MKNESFDEFETLIDEEIKKEEKTIDKIIQSREGLKDMKASEELKQRIFHQIQEEQEELEQGQKENNIVNMLSEEDREALIAGREYLKKKENEDEEPTKKVVRKKKKIWKQVAVLAAAVGFMFAMGITSVGGPERIIDILKQAIGGREVEMVDSTSKETVPSVENQEEEVYQKIKDEYGVEAVKIMNRPEGMQFKNVHMDVQLQVATMIYTSNKEQLVYIINTPHTDASMGLDVEDELAKEEKVQLKKAEATMKTYKVKDTEETKYIVTFEYQKTRYTLVTRLKREEIELILNNLHFF